jgi:hypothetical protein
LQNIIEMKYKINFLVICFLLVFLTISTLSQSSFTYEVKTLKDERLYDAIEDGSGNYLMVGMRYSSAIQIVTAYYLFLDNSGNLLAEQEFNNSDSSSLFGIVYYRNDSIYIIGTKGSVSSGIKDELWLLILDENFNIILNKSFRIEGVNIVTLHYIINSRSNFLICGTGYNPQTDLDLFFYEISGTGDSISLVYKSMTGYQLACDIIQKPSGEYKIFGRGVYPGSLLFAGKMVEFDSAFNFISVDTIPYGLYNNNTAKWISDSTYLVTGKKNTGSNNEVGIVKLNLEDQFIESNHFGKTDTNHHVGAELNLDFISRANIYFGGTANIFEDHLMYQHEHSWIILNNIDSNLNLNWQKYYGGDAFYYLWAIRATSDGGCLLLCARYDAEVQNQEMDVYILKVDSSGLLTSTGEGPQIPVQQLAIVPNPAIDAVSIRYPDIFGYDEKEIEIFNVQGMSVIKVSATSDVTEKRIDIARLPTGLYFVVLKVEGKKVATGKLLKI